MKKLLSILFLLLFLMLNAHSKEVLTMAIGEWAPYTSSTEVTGLGELLGFFIQNI